jgi:hypothetical protein
VTNTDDTVSVYINPNLANAEPVSPTIIANNPNESIVLDFTNLDIISAVLFQKGPSVQIGGIKVTNSWSQLNVDIPTSTSEVHTNNQLYYQAGSLISSSPGVLNVFSLQGVLVFSKLTNGKIAVDLPKGLYVVRFNDVEGRIFSQKLIVR